MNILFLISVSSSSRKAHDNYYNHSNLYVIQQLQDKRYEAGYQSGDSIYANTDFHRLPIDERWAVRLTIIYVGGGCSNI